MIMLNQKKRLKKAKMHMTPKMSLNRAVVMTLLNICKTTPMVIVYLKQFLRFILKMMSTLIVTNLNNTIKEFNHN